MYHANYTKKYGTVVKCPSFLSDYYQTCIFVRLLPNLYFCPIITKHVFLSDYYQTCIFVRLLPNMYFCRNISKYTISRKSVQLTWVESFSGRTYGRTPRHEEEADSRSSQFDERTSKTLSTSDSKKYSRYRQSHEYLANIRRNAEHIAIRGRGGP
jgi:hypothetical protein